jgi:hypothetical protein
MVIRDVLDHVLAEDIVERFFLKEEAASRVEVQDVGQQRESIHIKPTRQRVLSAPDMQFFGF